MAALHAQRRFAVASFAPGLLNVAFLAGAFLLPGPLERAGLDRSYAMAIAALVGGLLQVLAQWPELRRTGYGARPRLDFSDPSVREVFRRITPMTFGIGVYYVDLVLSRRFLSELGPGAQSYFSWAMRLCDFPLGIFVMALSTAALPSLSALAAEGKREELVAAFAYGVRLTLFVALPASVLLVFLGEPLVRALFQRGEFDSTATRETARALLYQGGALWTVALVRQLVAVLHASGDTRAPVVVSVVDLVVFVALAVALKGPMGHAGVSAAVAGSSAVQMLLLFVAVRRRHGTMALGRIVPSAAKTLLAAGGAVLAVRFALPAIERLGPAFGGAAVLCAFGAIFLALAAALRSGELDALTSGVRRRLAKKPTTD
ncbi:MAG: oligosaccharide flippase family protein [Myxococcales bacterium]|nr:oligosaccharide flippase family protein [Myxococcales bacterium]